MSLRAEAVAQFQRDFFLRPTVSELDQHFLMEDEKFRQQQISRGNLPYSSVKIRRYHQRTAGLFFSVTPHPIDDELIENFRNDARYYIGTQESTIGSNHPENLPRILADSRLSTVISHPEFIADEQAISVLEILAKAKETIPMTSFTTPIYQGEPSRHNFLRDEIKPGFGVDQLKGFDRIIGSEKLWTSGSGVFASTFMRNIAVALEIMSVKEPLETLEARLNLILKSMEHHDRRDIQQHTVYTFRTPHEKGSLQMIVNEAPASPVTRRFADILAGRFESIDW